MKKEVRVVDEKQGIVRITCTDERWYAKPKLNADTQLPEYSVYPSVTWIVSVYPKPGLQKYRDQVGAEEAELAKKLGGERGSKVHAAISAIIRGEEVRVDSKFENPSTGYEEELSPDEVRYIQAFIDWKNAVKPKFLAWDVTVYSEHFGFAGTLDAVVEINGEIWLIDFKTSKVMGTDYEMQVSAYAKAITDGENIIEAVEEARMRLMSERGDNRVTEVKLALLQLGATATKTMPQEYRWKPVENRFELFVAVKAVWADMYETQIKDQKGFSQKDYPLVLSPGVSVEEALGVEPEPETPEFPAGLFMSSELPDSEWQGVAPEKPEPVKKGKKKIPA